MNLTPSKIQFQFCILSFVVLFIMSGIILKKKITYLNIGERRYKHIEIIVDVSQPRTRSHHRCQFKNRQNRNSEISAYNDLTQEVDSTPTVNSTTVSQPISPVYSPSTNTMYSPYREENRKHTSSITGTQSSLLFTDIACLHAFTMKIHSLSPI